MKRHILILEDDLELARLIKAYLQDQRFIVTHFSQAHTALKQLPEQQFDMLLCDINLPGKNGFEFVQEVRAEFAGPILFMTALTDTKSQLKGYELGAEDYLVKPINPELLLAKINVFFKLDRQVKPQQTLFQMGNLTLDTNSKTSYLNGEKLNLTSAEFRLLTALLAQFGHVVSREWLFQHHLGREYDGIDRAMDGRASRLRKKLQLIDPSWNVITAWGEGYYLSKDDHIEGQ
ncbi:response regulator transcription factor [Psychrosphaera sp. B3R10]|uniref:response regulator transcription factor n=1 Tax=unclassified Psychrosphaera TaxID=2641570 RepID=UPI001C092549|nr:MULTISPECIES: response regulator transcription factor [unclassified Psychrosphaera]MBU2883128.1 response regulator transcription factor [Psychrosphaera sp. I2R16]MBU2988584.1 response regulator transcription factor [Psychrosphaera sp. B3R10]